ncbi:hypothetical protein VTK56DRAFT_5334 [Thermocarpiscus australiensis]
MSPSTPANHQTNVPYPKMTRIWVEVPGDSDKAKELLRPVKTPTPGSNIEHKFTNTAIGASLSRAFFIPYSNAHESRHGNTGKFLNQHRFVYKHMSSDRDGPYAVFGPSR